MMHDDWHFEQIKEYNDSFAQQWEAKTLEKPSASQAFELQPLSRENISLWVDAKAEDVIAFDKADVVHSPSPRILITRNSQYKTLEPKPECLPFRKQDFCDIIRKLKLPPACIYTRIHGGASGCFSRHITRDELGHPSRIGFVLRVPHAPRNEVKSVWSIALSWEVRSQLANVFFDGASDVDVNLLLDSLNAAPIHHLGHPLLIPCLLLDQLGIYYNENWRGIARELFQIERKLGLTRGRSKANPWSWNQSRFRSITYDISDVTTGLVYIERRLNFTLNLANNLEKNITSIDHDLGYDAHRNRASQYLQEKLGNTISFLENQIHQVKCLQKRSEAFTNTVYTIVAQIANNTNIRIGVSAKHDSASMMSIAYVTIIFLPPTFIATLFGTNFFVFNNISGMIMSSRFWVYWVTTIPVTIAVIAVWRIWMHYQYRPFEESLGMMEAGNLSSEEKSSLHDDIESPFYPLVYRENF